MEPGLEGWEKVGSKRRAGLLRAAERTRMWLQVVIETALPTQLPDGIKFRCGGDAERRTRSTMSVTRLEEDKVSQCLA